MLLVKTTQKVGQSMGVMLFSIVLFLFPSSFGREEALHVVLS